MAYTEIRLTLDDLRKLERDGKLTIPARGVCLGTVIVFDKPTNSATGAEIKDFFDNGWDMDYYHESGDAEVQLQDDLGYWLLRPDRLYDVSKLGMLESQTTHLAAGKPASMTFEEAYLKYRGTK